MDAPKLERKTRESGSTAAIPRRINVSKAIGARNSDSIQFMSLRGVKLGAAPSVFAKFLSDERAAGPVASTSVYRQMKELTAAKQGEGRPATLQELREMQVLLRSSNPPSMEELVAHAKSQGVVIPEGKVLANGDSSAAFGREKFKDTFLAGGEKLVIVPSAVTGGEPMAKAFFDPGSGADAAVNHAIAKKVERYIVKPAAEKIQEMWQGIGGQSGKDPAPGAASATHEGATAQEDPGEPLPPKDA